MMYGSTSVIWIVHTSILNITYQLIYYTVAINPATIVAATNAYLDTD